MQKDPRLVELILSESVRVVRSRPNVLIVEHRLGFVMANAGIDQSNVAPQDGVERALLLPKDPDASAEALRAKLGADTVPRPVIVLRSVPVGYRVERFSSADATIAIWYVGIVGSGATVQPQQSWRTQVVSLVWEAGAWKVSSFASSSGPTPPLSAVEAAYVPGDLFAAIQSQLGLRLAPKKGPVELLFIDSADKVPVEN